MLWGLLPLVALFMLTSCERKISGTVQNDDTVSDQCFNCHNGQLDAPQGEWAHSVHASGASIDYTNRPAPDNCTRCHNQQGFIDWVSTGTINPPYENAKAIGCFACHNPHETGNFSRRTVAPVTLASGDVFDHDDGNLCANCHQARENVGVITNDFVITSSRFGPHHSQQGDLLAGFSGYEGFPGYTKQSSISHSSIDGACAGCHMANVRTHDGYEVGGHSFNMENEAGDNLSLFCRNCHGEIGSSGGAYALIRDSVDHDNDGVVEGFQDEVDGMLDSLRTLLIAEGILNGSTDLLITQTVADGDLMGAAWNWLLISDDHSRGVHNPKYVVSLLGASIAHVSGL
jgi:hypothetical protein